MSRIGWSLLFLDRRLLDFPVEHSPIITIMVVLSVEKKTARTINRAIFFIRMTSGIGSVPGLQGIQHSGGKSNAIRKN